MSKISKKLEKGVCLLFIIFYRQNQERRRHPRETILEKVIFSVNIHEFLETKRVEAEADIINKSESGLCLKTLFPLEPGHVLIINNDEIGVVRWSRRVDSYYIAGIMRKGKINGLPTN